MWYLPTLIASFPILFFHTIVFLFSQVFQFSSHALSYLPSSQASSLLSSPHPTACLNMYGPGKSLLPSLLLTFSWILTTPWSFTCELCIFQEESELFDTCVCLSNMYFLWAKCYERHHRGVIFWRYTFPETQNRLLAVIFFWESSETFWGKKNRRILGLKLSSYIVSNSLMFIIIN